MHPWFSWVPIILFLLMSSSLGLTRCFAAFLVLMDRLAYGFEALMVNEFHNLDLLCVPPALTPPYGALMNQGCALPGAVSGSNLVNGEAYLEAQLNYSYSHLWRNVGIIVAFWMLFVLMTLIGMELTLRPSKSGGNVTVYRKGTTLPSTKRLSENMVLDDEEAQRKQDTIQRENQEQDERLDDSYGLVKSITVLTWLGLRYVINVPGGQRVLLDNVMGYVKPGRLTALMGGRASKSNGITNCRVRGWKNNVIELPLKENIDGCSRWRYIDRWKTIASFVPTRNRLCRATRFARAYFHCSRSFTVFCTPTTTRRSHAPGKACLCRDSSQIVRARGNR